MFFLELDRERDRERESEKINKYKSNTEFVTFVSLGRNVRATGVYRSLKPTIVLHN